MGIISYYLATSVDGYLAREDGSVDWLNPFQSKINTPYDYEVYYNSVSTVLMGRKTWEVSKSFEESPFMAKKRIIISKSKNKTDFANDCEVYDKINLELIEKIKSEANGKVWLVGGASIASQLNELNCLDEIVQTIVPVMIGRGIPWFDKQNSDTQWDLKDVFKAENGIVQLIYNRKK